MCGHVRVGCGGIEIPRTDLCVTFMEEKECPGTVALVVWLALWACAANSRDLESSCWHGDGKGRRLADPTLADDD